MTGSLYDDTVYVKLDSLMSTVGFNYVLITCTVINARDTHCFGPLTIQKWDFVQGNKILPCNECDYILGFYVNHCFFKGTIDTARPLIIHPTCFGSFKCL
jgi:hypothetical protein